MADGMDEVTETLNVMDWTSVFRIESSFLRAPSYQILHLVYTWYPLSGLGILYCSYYSDTLAFIQSHSMSPFIRLNGDRQLLTCRPILFHPRRHFNKSILLQSSTVR